VRCMIRFVFVVATLAVAVAPASGQSSRPDAIWARHTSSLTLDGVLNEAAWAAAESMIVRYPRNAGIPGSGWKEEGGVLAQDSTYAVLKFLTVRDQLYLGARFRDRSIGGSEDFNRFDGILMAIKDHSVAAAPKPPAEYFYSWWYPTLTDPQPPDQLPAFAGKWATWPPGTPRTQEQINAWDARTVVNGRSNTDAVADQGYTIEMRFDLAVMGYQIRRQGGDVIEWNISIYDCDWFWPLDPNRFSSNRTWWQSPWGNDAWYNEVRIHASPDVGINSGPVPSIAGDTGIPNAAGEPAPVVDGLLNEGTWAYPTTKAFDLRFGDDQLRGSYPSVGPYRSGQYQPEVYGGLAPVIDPGEAEVRWFFRGNELFLGFDVNDQVVQYHPNINRWDGFIVTINDRVVTGPDHQLLGRRLSFQVSQDGTALPQDYLATLVEANVASVALQLKEGTVVDTLGFEPDAGYTAELRIDLTALGYPNGLGDGVLFLGVNLLDGDSFLPVSDSYGSRTWWYREYEGTCCPAWVELQPGFVVTGFEDSPARIVAPRLVEAVPNPAATTTIRYELPRPARVALQIFDVGGRLIERRELGLQPAGLAAVPVDSQDRPAGLYYYRLAIEDGAGHSPEILEGRFVVVR